MRTRGWRRGRVASLLISMVLVGCAGPPSPPAPAAATAAPPAAPPTVAAAPATVAAKPAAASAPTVAAPKPATQATKAQFDALVARAKAGPGRLRAVLAGASLATEDVKALEDGFEQRFGFRVTLEDEPGHESQEVTPKILQATKANTPMVDWLAGQTTATAQGLMKAQALRVPPWDALTEEWPQIADLRELTPALSGGANNTTLRDYCMLRSQTVYTFFYNTRTVKPEEVKGLVWDDLLTDKWKGRVAFQDGAGGFYIIPFHKDWPEERMKAYGQNLGANGLKIAAGGSAGMLQFIIQGEADLGIGEAAGTYLAMSKGAPLAFAWPEVVPTNQSVGCLPALPVNNPDLGALFWAWRSIEGEWILAARGGGGARPFYAPEADKYPLGKLIKDNGLTAEKNLSAPTTEQDSVLLGQYRDSALAALRTGIQSHQKVPYPWGCKANHPSCVQ